MSLGLGRRESGGPAETEAVAAEVVRGLSPGDVVLVEGELGAGKTTFVRAACRALGIHAAVTSPTFTIGQLYPGPVPVAHLDLYRLTDLDEEDPELLGDYLGPDKITFVEWPEVGMTQIEALGRVALRVRLLHAGEDRRTIELDPGS